MKQTTLDANREMELDGFVRHLKDLIRGAPEGRIIFFVGSGCSISSGIPSGSDLARSWLMRLAERDQENIAEIGLSSWADHLFPRKKKGASRTKEIPSALEMPGNYYSEIGEKLFISSKRLQHHEIELLTANKFPGIGYAVLAQLMADSKLGGQMNLVLTTNFDDLIADALYLYTNRRPMVLVHERLFDFAIPSRVRPLIIKLHGDRLFASRNQPDEVKRQTSAVMDIFERLPHDSALIFTGYSGSDVSVVNALNKCADSHFSLGIFWIHLDEPDDAWREIRTRYPFTKVKHRDFDTLMVRLAHELAIEPPRLDRAHELRVRHKDSLRALDASCSPDDQSRDLTASLGALSTKEHENVLQDIERLLSVELGALGVTDRQRIFLTLAQSPTFAVELDSAMKAAATQPVHSKLSLPPDAEQAIKDQIVHHSRDARHHLALAQLLMSIGKSREADARHHLDQALADPSLMNDASAVGADAYLSAISRDIDNSIWERFERALSLDPHHRSNLVNYLVVLLADPERFVFGAVSAWKRGEQILRRLFALPWDEPQSAEWFTTLYCAEAFYRKSFASHLKDSGWPDIFPDHSLALEPALVFLDIIASRADTAEPDSDSGWARGDNISDEEFGDMEELRKHLNRIAAEQGKSPVTQFASSFLSHTWPDKDLVRAVSIELGKQGILTWFDEKELRAGQDLPSTLESAIQEQATFSVFLSHDALAAPWVQNELEIALASRDTDQRRRQRILPVFLGEPLSLVKASPQLASRWLHADGKRVIQFGIKVDPTAPSEANAPVIAAQVADSVFDSINTAAARRVAIHIDQRGSSREGFPKDIPANLQEQPDVGLVFRPAGGIGAPKETLIGSAWTDSVARLHDALNRAFHGLRWSESKAIHITGNAQLGLAYLIGHHFNRSSAAVLYCSDTRGTAFNNEGWDKYDMLHGGDACCEANADAGLPPIPTAPFKDVVLIIGRQNVAEGALPYLNATRPDVPIAWVRSPQHLDTSDDVKTLVADVTALAQRLKRENGCRTAYLVLGLPFAAVPLLAAHMQYVLDRFVLLEYRGDIASDADDRDTYAELEFPR